MSAEARAINFGAGPSALPQSVLEETAKGLLNFEGTGIGIAEISHRSKEFTAYVRNLESLIRDGGEKSREVNIAAWLSYFA